MNNAEIDVIPQIMNEDFVFTIPTHPEVFKGTKGFEEEVTGLHGAFPDVHLDVHHKWCFDDLILGLWTGTGTHIGDKPLSTPKGPLPATGNSFVIQGVSWISADGVLLRENLANEDTLKIIHDLGVKDCTKIYSNAAASLASARQFPTQSTKKTTAQSQFAINFKYSELFKSIDAILIKATSHSFIRKFTSSLEYGVDEKSILFFLQKIDNFFKEFFVKEYFSKNFLVIGFFL
mgnify:CR=1 FL=1